MDSNNTDYRRRTARQDAGQQNVRRQSARQQPPRQGQPTQNSTSRRTAQQNPGRRNAAQTGAPQSTAQPRNGTQQPRRPQSRPMRTPPPAAKPIKEHNDQPTETIIRLRGSVDRPFLILVIILVLIGSAMVFSASYAYAEYHFGDSLYFIRSQLRWVVVGFGFMFIAMNFDYRWFQKLTMPAFFGTFVLLCLVPVIGKTVKGATRWIEVGPIQIQPSEMMKLALVMVLALYIAANRGQMGKFRYGILFPYTIIGAVCFVTALEKHLSATMILLMIGTLVIFIGGAPVKWLGIFMGSGAGLVALAFMGFRGISFM